MLSFLAHLICTILFGLLDPFLIAYCFLTRTKRKPPVIISSKHGQKPN